MAADLYRDPAAPLDARVADLLSRMTPEEKTGQLNQRMYGWDAYERTPDGHRLTDAFRAEAARFGGMGALYGLQRADPWSGVDFATGITAADAAEAANAVQRHVVENTRLGIPVLLVEEMPHGHQALDGTVLPVNLAAGASWDPDAYGRAVAGSAAELRARGAHVALVSALDLLRDPRWGRAEECFGEDPHLAARFTEALVHGVQGDAGADGPFAPDKAAVVLKHFAGQGASVGGRNSAATELGARELHEIHLPAARAGVRAGAAGVMAAYNEFDGLPCAANRWLLTELLREDWGFGGIVMADGGALDRLVRLTGDAASAVAMALDAGLDLSLWDEVYPRIPEAVAAGLVPESTLDRAVGRVLRLKFRLGLFEQPYTSGGPLAPSTAPLRGASVTLLRNSGLLPFGPEVRRLAVIGPNADSLANQIGDYTAPQRPGTGTTVLDGIRAAAPAGTEISHTAGCRITGGDTSGIPDAVARAARADAAVLVLGGSSAREPDTVFDTNGAAITAGAAPADMTCGEGVDLADLRLGPAQRALLAAVTATGTPTAVVLVQGRPHAEPADGAGALLTAWYPGPDGGRDVADVLFGRAEPEGRLPVTVPRSAGQLPVFYNAKDHGFRGYADEPAGPLFPFGHGLSYSTVEYGAPTLSADTVTLAELAAGATVACTVELANTGPRPAVETVQLYISRRTARGGWPRVRELRGFAKVRLEPGERRPVRLELGRDALAFTGRDLTTAPEPGVLDLATGPSSAPDTLTAAPLTVLDR